MALTSLGFDTRGTDGAFGARSREMIAAWQKVHNDPPTGYLTGAQSQALLRDAAPAIATTATPESEGQKLLDAGPLGNLFVRFAFAELVVGGVVRVVANQLLGRRIGIDLEAQLAGEVTDRAQVRLRGPREVDLRPGPTYHDVPDRGAHRHLGVRLRLADPAERRRGDREHRGIVEHAAAGQVDLDDGTGDERGRGAEVDGRLPTSGGRRPRGPEELLAGRHQVMCPAADPLGVEHDDVGAGGQDIDEQVHLVDEDRLIPFALELAAAIAELSRCVL